MHDGSFVICGVPDGDYVLRGWNDMGAEARAPLQVQGAGLIERHLELSETRRSLRAHQQVRRPYPGKYR